MVTQVTDARSNPNDQIHHAATTLRQSTVRTLVFKAIYHGRKKAKTVTELVKMTKLKRQAVLDAGKKLESLHIIDQLKIDGEIGYGKDAFYATNKEKILRLAGNPNKLAALPTKISPKGSGTQASVIKVIVQGTKVQITQITVEDFDQFSKIKKIGVARHQKLSEKAFKQGVCNLIGETGSFQDWGGEKNDLYTTKLKYKGQRRAIAFAFKGPGMTGALTPRKLGRNGDQIQRLFMSAAEIFIVQYHSQIDESVVEQMVAFATLKSASERRRIYYGVIDGDDTNRLLSAYPKKFGL